MSAAAYGQRLSERVPITSCSKSRRGQLMPPAMQSSYSRVEDEKHFVLIDSREYDDIQQNFQALFPLDGRKDLKRFVNDRTKVL